MKLIGSIPILRSLARFYDLWMFQRKWRKLNAHNQTHVSSIFPVEVVSVGKYSYGMLNIYSYNPAVEKLIIGNFVSIGPNVHFLLGGLHQMDTISTYPWTLLFNPSSKNADAQTKGPIIVEDEVWIGMNAVILSGVTIGKGAVVAACAVVTRDVPPYSIVGGNPARIIKYRFDEDVRCELMKVNLLDYSQIQIEKNLYLLYNKIQSAEDVKTFAKSMEE
jgi:acetyltransferase-like isoleucine patch superfamily enzyme